MTPTPPTGRFAPSPTGDLHLGNLRTALVAWWSARSVGGTFRLRIEDLDRVTSSPAHEARQLADLTAVGIDWDGEVVRQSDRFHLHHAAIARLVRDDLVYPCFCTRREIQTAAAAPHGEEARYPGTCRELSGRARRDREATGRPAALRLRRQVDTVGFDDLFAGPQRFEVDDIVLRRNDGVPAYNLAVVVDDAEQGVDEVVRGDDLLPVTSSQLHLADLLGVVRPRHAHVPLVLNHRGQRLAKRDGAVTLRQLREAGVPTGRVVTALARSLDQAGVRAAGFDPSRIGRHPLVLPEDPVAWFGRTETG